ncbi:class I SAM-dependent methyltransferase [Bradyrhizobium sp. LHD-71]|uniref:class I SAM-dependent methyltransferase n=1 Tax=Bradyrhizobium sp. LHD-71 TaxID=3072141 RepID=UPI00280EEFC5|nr:class I SAM-dependent methyltransferase [Bradyrhizobium sp. LHD-71]MDQ8732608.1 class I SAM-dependent methyltransferase [Bradyrhizobium sp. LHD-71]
MSERRGHWDHVYATKRENEVSWFQENPAISMELILATGATRASSIVDIGGGASRLVDSLLQAGFRAITVLDLSEAALAAARARLGGRAAEVEWITSDVTRWKPSRQHDVWHDRAALHFLTDADDRAAYVACLKSALRVGGQAIIGTFAPDGPEKCSGLLVQRYDATGLQQTLGEDFRLAEQRREIHTTPWGSAQSFQFARLLRTR